MPELLTTDQRQFEGTDPLMWGAVGGTLTRDTVAPLKDLKSLKMVSTATTAYFYPTVSAGGSEQFPITASPRLFRAGAWFKGPTGRAMQLWVRRWLPGLGSWVDAVFNFTSTGSIQWIGGHIEVLADTPAVSFYVLDFASVIGDSYWLDSATHTDTHEPSVMTVELGLAADPLDAQSTVAWTDVTAYAKDAEWGHGRTHERNPIQAGTATVRLDNSDGRFDPMNTTGPYWPDLLPMKRLRISLTKHATVYRQFTGYIDSYLVSRANAVYAETEIRATDAFKLLNQLNISDPYEWTVNQYAPRAFYRFKEAGNGSVTQLRDSSGSERTASLFNPKIEINGHSEGYEFIEHPAAPGGRLVELWDTDFAGLGQASESQYSAYGRAEGAGVTGTSPFTIIFNYQRAQYNTTVNGSLVAQAERSPFTDSGDHLLIQDVVFDDQGLGLRVAVYRNAATLLDTTFVVGRFTGADFFPSAIGTQYLDQVVIVRTGTLFELYFRAGGYPSDSPMYNSATASADPSFTSSRIWFATATGHEHENGLFYTFPGLFGELAVIPSALTNTDVNAIYATIDRWKGQLPGARVGGVLDMVGWPAADRSLETGGTPLAAFADAGKSALDHLLQVALADDGLFYITPNGKAFFYGRHHLLTSSRSITPQVIFGDGGAPEVPYEPQGLAPLLDERDLYNEVVGSREGGVPQTATDPASITTYGRRSLSETGILAESDNDIADRVKFRAQQYSQPAGRVQSLTFSELDSDMGTTAVYPPALGLALWDRMIYRQRLEGAALWEQDSIVEGVRHRYDAESQSHKITVAFSSIPAVFTEGGYWVLNTNELDSTAKLAY